MDIPEEKPPLQFKLVMLGDTAVGKSSIVMRFVRKQFTETQESTIGAAFFTQTVFCDNVKIQYEIWDTAGQERYHSLAPMYYRGAAVALVVYDITRRKSFERAIEWVKELKTEVGDDNPVIMMVGNKYDLPDSSRQVQSQEAIAYASNNGLMFTECSAKTNHNITEMFLKIAHALPKTAQKDDRDIELIDGFFDESKSNKKKGGCC